MYFRTMLFVYLASFRLCGQVGTNDYYPPTPVPDRIMLNLTDTPSTSTAVNWRTSLPVAKSYVQITEADPGPDLEGSARVIAGTSESFMTDLNGARFHSATLDDLRPGTQYAYRVGDSLHWSEWNHFTTAEAGEAPLSFLYFGDAQNDIKSLWSRAIRGAYAKMPEADFMLHAGDLINRSDRDHEWGEWFYAGGWIYGMMPSIATPGNHEYGRTILGDRELSPHWRPTFHLPENGPADYPETVYYVDYQGTRVISLDSPAFLRDSSEANVQMDWLRGLLADNPNTWTIVTMHHPVYSSRLGRDNLELREGLQPIFEEFGVDLVLQGHDHTYGRGTNLPIGSGKQPTIDGPIYVVSVSGPKMYDLSLEPWMQRGASNTQLYQLIEIDGDVLHFTAYTVTGQKYDAFELRKQGAGQPNVFIDQAPADVPERLALPPRFEREYTDEERAVYRNRFEEYEARKN
ncbi:purple acid phosphatase family protein [Lewinella sp. IMCC34191]|uniref:purple acid phosphatase family protein n=1 Tax=Lewinella sp. IMCC34191 TaxID=2259172 RepID=UPI0018E59472|nr:metallophosphoesterase family protein [Lewinella sp. IMCC34191]